jgi:hypothetical protein
MGKMCLSRRIRLPFLLSARQALRNGSHGALERNLLNDRARDAELHHGSLARPLAVRHGPGDPDVFVESSTLHRIVSKGFQVLAGIGLPELGGNRALLLGDGPFQAGSPRSGDRVLLRAPDHRLELLWWRRSDLPALVGLDVADFQPCFRGIASGGGGMTVFFLRGLRARIHEARLKSLHRPDVNPGKEEGDLRSLFPKHEREGAVKDKLPLVRWCGAPGRSSRIA